VRKIAHHDRHHIHVGQCRLRSSRCTLHFRDGSFSTDRRCLQDVRFSNRPVGVKRFQTVHYHSIDVAHGLVLLFGIGTKALPSWESKTRRNNLPSGLAVTNGRSKRLGELTSSIVPRGTSFHRRAELEFPPIVLSGVILHGSHAAVGTCSLVHRNSVPSTQMRCRITANRRARATIAFFIPRRLAICIAQALSQDHLLVRVSMTWAASYSIFRIISSPQRDILPLQSISPD